MLHIINKSALTGGTLDILLIEDAVYAATKCNALEAKLRAALGKFKIHVLMPDLEARGLGDRLMEGVSPVDFGGFVDLACNNKNCQSWL